MINIKYIHGMNLKQNKMLNTGGRKMKIKQQISVAKSQKLAGEIRYAPTYCSRILW